MTIIRELWADVFRAIQPRNGAVIEMPDIPTILRELELEQLLEADAAEASAAADSGDMASLWGGEANSINS